MIKKKLSTAKMLIETCKRATEERADMSKEIAKLNGQIERMRSNSLYMRSDAEKEADEQFRKEHGERCKNDSGYMYLLVETELGTGINIICPVCGEKKNITDYDWW